MQTIYFLKAYHAGKQYRPVLTQYHWVPTSTGLYWPSIQWFEGLDQVNKIFFESISHWQPVPPCLDLVSSSTDQYHPILTQYHQVTKSTVLHRPSTIKYQSVPKEYHLADLLSTLRHIKSHQGSSLIRATCHFFFKMKILKILCRNSTISHLIIKVDPKYWSYMPVSTPENEF